jgi:hypothetical protein
MSSENEHHENEHDASSVGGMTSAARIAANRRNALASTGPRTGAGKARAAQNAQHSTGPRTSEGKARSAQNALRHGLTHSAAGDPGWSNEIKALAHSIAGADASPGRCELACRVAEAQIDVMRARRARTDLYSAFTAAIGERDGNRAARSHRRLRAARACPPQSRDPGIRCARRARLGGSSLE